MQEQNKVIVVLCVTTVHLWHVWCVGVCLRVLCSAGWTVRAFQSPWCNRNGWLHVKHQVTYLLTYLLTYLPSFPILRKHAVSLTGLTELTHCLQFAERPPHSNSLWRASRAHVPEPAMALSSFPLHRNLHLTRKKKHTHPHTHAHTHARTHARTRAHTHTHTHTHARTHARTHAHAHTRTRTHTHTHTHTHARARARKHTHIRTQANTHTHTHTHAQTHTHTHTHTHTRARARARTQTHTHTHTHSHTKTITKHFLNSRSKTHVTFSEYSKTYPRPTVTACALMPTDHDVIESGMKQSWLNEWIRFQRLLPDLADDRSRRLTIVKRGVHALFRLVSSTVLSPRSLCRIAAQEEAKGRAVGVIILTYNVKSIVLSPCC